MSSKRNIELTKPVDLDVNHLTVLLKKRFETKGKHEPGGLAVIGRDCSVFRLYATNADDYVSEIEGMVKLAADP